MSDDIVFRDAVDDDRHYIADCWLKSYKRSPWAGTVPNNLMPAVVFETIRQLYERGMRIRVATSPIDGEIMGFVAVEPGEEPVVHYWYVREDYREQGVGRDLLAEVGIDGSMPYLYTHRTFDSSRLPGKPRHMPEVARRRRR